MDNFEPPTTIICAAARKKEMLVAGVDYSGNQKTGSKFLGVVIGTPEAISLAVKRLGPGSTHVGRIRNKKRQSEIFSKLCFDENTIIALCIRSDIDLVAGRVRKKSKRQNSTKQIMDTYDRHLYQHILKNTTMFFVKHGCDAHEVVFQYGWGGPR